MYEHEIYKINCPELNNELDSENLEVLVAFKGITPSRIMCSFYDDRKCQLKSDEEDSDCTYIKWRDIR